MFGPVFTGDSCMIFGSGICVFMWENNAINQQFIGMVTTPPLNMVMMGDGL